MRIAFTGDFVLQEISGEPEYLFGDLKAELEQMDARLSLNLESPFVPDGVSPVKSKIVLHAPADTLKYVRFLAPHYINLSNNHINDFGNASVLLTIQACETITPHWYGLKIDGDDRICLVEPEQKLVFVAFTDSSTDTSVARLFANGDSFGPMPPDLNLISALKRQYPDFKLIVNIHWGLEDIRYPKPWRRVLACQMVDSGADLIIGHHPHIVQPFEKYKGKYIFYSLGNLYFPPLTFKLHGQLYPKVPYYFQKKGIVPVIAFDESGIRVADILEVVQKHGRLSVQKGYRLPSIAVGMVWYQFLSFVLLPVDLVWLKVLKLWYDPRVIIRKLKKLLNPVA